MLTFFTLGANQLRNRKKVSIGVGRRHRANEWLLVGTQASPDSNSQEDRWRKR